MLFIMFCFNIIKTPINNIIKYPLLILISLFLLSSCIDLRSHDVTTIHITTTTGKELQDLQVALESGAINQEEYDKLKENIINRMEIQESKTE